MREATTLQKPSGDPPRFVVFGGRRQPASARMHLRVCCHPADGDYVRRMGDLKNLADQIAECRLCADRFKATATAHEPRPVVVASTTARLLVAGQAPGARVHASGVPFDDPSGDRLRDWMGIGRDIFYDRSRIAIVPMAFCFPGYDAKGSDLPPPKECARTWQEPLMAAMPQIETTLLVGGYAQKWHLGRDAGPNLTETVRAWRTYIPRYLPLPHPSWRNTAWLKRNPWFDEEVLPWLRTRVRQLAG